MAKRPFLPKDAADVDPTLAALFASSSGPVEPAKKPRYSPWTRQEVTDQTPDPDTASDGSQDVDLGHGEDEEDDGQLESSSSSAEEAPGSADGREPASDATALSKLVISSERQPRKRKRKQSDALDDIERKHMERVADDEDEEQEEEEVPAKRPKKDEELDIVGDAVDDDDDDATALVHESLLPTAEGGEVEQASRTVFLSNVSTEAITSRKAKKRLLAHLSSVLDKEASPPQSIMSLRFRSVPVATAAIPKRAAVITHAVMEATTRSTNAYAVYSNVAAARAAASKLNGTVVLDRHLRVDSVAHPSPVDHKRCVFVGNLGFVDDETIINLTMDEEGREKTEKRKRTKTPMDVEEGLWRTFGQGDRRVENVRVVRDTATRVGKGFAYVQFYDPNSVESALLLDGKKFPPLLPRALRVTRCKAPHKTLRAVERSHKAKAASLAGSASKSTKYVRKATEEERTSAGRAGKLLGRAAAARVAKPKKPLNDARRGERTEIKSPEEIVFEGQRASVKDGKPRDLKLGKVKKTTKALSNNKKRRAARTASWKKRGQH